MAITINDTEELKALVETDVANILAKDIAPIVHSELAEEYEKQVYSYVGTEVYARRYSLTDEANMSDTVTSNGITVELEVESTAKPSPSLLGSSIDDNANLADWIENGNIANPWNNKDYPWTKSRPVFKTVQSKLDSSDKITNTIKRSLKAKGYDVK